jgi:hypothetical protein
MSLPERSLDLYFLGVYVQSARGVVNGTGGGTSRLVIIVRAHPRAANNIKSLSHNMS